MSSIRPSNRFYPNLRDLAIAVLLFFLVNTQVQAAAINMHGMFDTLSGFTVSENRLIYLNSEIAAGRAFTAQAVFIFPSFAFEHVSSDFSSNNLLVGIGFANLVQVQTGTGDQGSLWRIHSDLFLINYFKEGWDDPLFPTYAEDWMEKLCLSLSYEKYSDVNIGQVYQIGIGYSF